jgi:hypothetical protein
MLYKERRLREERHVPYVPYVHYIQEGFYRSLVVYLKDHIPYLDSSFLIVILRIQLELIYWATHSTSYINCIILY